MKLKEKFTLDYQISSAISYYNKKINTNKDINNQLINLTINNETNLVNILNVKFERKNIIYKKKIYIIMTKEMENNLTNNNNIQYFADITYNAVPYSNKKFKLRILIAFNKEVQHSILCCLALIKNENKETFLTMFEYLINKYKFFQN